MLAHSSMAKKKYDVLEAPNYSPMEAVRYFHIPLSTLTYWTEEPNQLVILPSRRPTLLSFKNLVELYVLEGLRKIHGVHTSRIRTAVNFLLETERSRHPLADFDIRTEGKNVLFYKKGKPLNASLWGQYEIEEIIGGYLHRVERDPPWRGIKNIPIHEERAASQQGTTTSNCRDKSQCVLWSACFSQFKNYDWIPGQPLPWWRFGPCNREELWETRGRNHGSHRVGARAFYQAKGCVVSPFTLTRIGTVQRSPKNSTGLVSASN